MGSNDAKGWKKFRAIIYVTVIVGVMSAIILAMIEPSFLYGTGGGLLTESSLTASGKRDIALLFGLFFGCLFSFFLGTILIVINEKRFPVLTLVGFLTGCGVFLLYYLERLSYIHSTWDDEFTINQMSAKAFSVWFVVIGIFTLTGVVSALIKEVVVDK